MKEKRGTIMNQALTRETFPGALATLLEKRDKANAKKLRVKKHPPETVRFQIVLTKEALEQIDELKKRLGAMSRAEVIRDSLRLLDAILEEVEEGNEFMMKDRDGRIVTYKVFV
jgi:hypothetical protein